VLVCSSVSVLLGQAKVNDVNQVALFAEPHQEVVGFDVAVDEVPRVNKIYTTNL
jgi:hypothetical protein